MKLIKKLLPLVTIGATACSIAPALTSCGDSVYTIKFDANGGSAVADQRVVKDQLLHEPTSEKTGCVLAGWYNGDKVWDFANDKASSNITLKAYWVEIPDPEVETIDLLSLDITNPTQHEEISVATGEAGIKEAAKMYFAEEGVTKEEIVKNITNDIIYQLAEDAKAASIAELIDPGCIEGFEWVGNIITADAIIKNTTVSYIDGTNYAKISGTIVLNLTAKMIDETTKKQIGEYVLFTQHDLTNVPYYFTDFNEAKHYWSCKTDPATLAKSEYNDWTLGRLYFGIAMYDNGETEIGKDNKFWQAGGSEQPTEANLKPISWDSTYMDTVAHGE